MAAVMKTPTAVHILATFPMPLMVAGQALYRQRNIDFSVVFGGTASIRFAFKTPIFWVSKTKTKAKLSLTFAESSIVITQS
jgi:hypothetical protein